MKTLCKRCLLEDMSLDEYTKSLKEYIDSYPAQKRADNEVYGKRLAICKSCDELSNGICAKCGCFVELRALKRDAYCASENKLW